LQILAGPFCWLPYFFLGRGEKGFKEYKKRGYAKELLGECQNWAKDQGCLEFASDCELDNEDSLKFHLKMGFAEANRIICFTKRLTDLEE